MVGLGEERNEVLQVMDDLRSADVDFLTIGQYLQPTRKHHPVMRFVTPDEFKAYETIAYAKGFLMVSASPLTRSSHHAGDDFARLKAARLAKHIRRLVPALGDTRNTMPSFRVTRAVKHSPQQMFDLVADVENYPALPAALRIPAGDPPPGHAGGRAVLIAEIGGYKAIRERFTSRVTLDPANLKILAEYLDGPFRAPREPLDLQGPHRTAAAPSNSSSPTSSRAARSAC